MGDTVVHSQLAPLPVEVPFHVVSKTIGSGAYACIKKARPANAVKPIFAVKFIHKEYALCRGRLTLKQLNLEITLHKHIGQHPHIIQFFQSGEDQSWKWIAMELAEGGDLFDKIESDVGVGEDIAHLYFTQLVSAVAYMHSKGVGHRDIKPENILLSAEGNLKIADFGLATLFNYNGQQKLCKTSCGSPPYTAPEVVTCDSMVMKKLSSGYAADLVDVWSCGVVLFVLLVGNTPWDEPLDRSYEFNEYVQTNGHPDDELWHRLPKETLPLLRGMMCVDTPRRLTLGEVQRHSWFTRQNRYRSPDGRLANPVAAATQMFESMKIDFSADPFSSSQSQRPGSQRVQTVTASSTPPGMPSTDDAMDIDQAPPTAAPPTATWQSQFAATQPETPANDIRFDWEAASSMTTFSQPSRPPAAQDDMILADRLSDEPSFSQFSQLPCVPLSRTQFAHRFHDILPSHSMTRFFSVWAFQYLLPLLIESLKQLKVPVGPLPQSALAGRDQNAWIRVKTRDDKRCPMSGDVVIERNEFGEEGTALLEITFVKGKGDPVEWRRFFKRAVLLCREAVFRPDA